LTQAKP